MINTPHFKAWYKIILFYGIILLVTYISRLLPNVLQLIIGKFSTVHWPYNFNHGITIGLVSILSYKYWYNKPTYITLLGNNKLKSLLFPLIMIIGYGTIGINNDQNINIYLWAIVACISTLLYDITEEVTWRGYLMDILPQNSWVIKGIISGFLWAIWHILIFNDFSQFGGFWGFAAMCIVFSILLTFGRKKSSAVIVPAAIHALMMKTNAVTLVCLVLYLIILFTWDKEMKLFRKK